METLVIMHFYNEEFYLPYWIKHHLKLFDHGVLIDYASTDSSVEICKKLCPTWEVIPSRNKLFDAVEVDREVMDIESNFSKCWKMVLNTTEFMMVPDLKVYIQKCGKNKCVTTKGILMIDTPEECYNPVAPDLPLHLQRHHGYMENPFIKPRTRCRIFHKHKNGNYLMGRHYTHHEAPYVEGAYCQWWGFSPWYIQRTRRLQFKHKIPPDHLKRGWGGEKDVVNTGQTDHLYSTCVKDAVDLMQDLEYKYLMENI